MNIGSRSHALLLLALLVVLTGCGKASASSPPTTSAVMNITTTSTTSTTSVFGPFDTLLACDRAEIAVAELRSGRNDVVSQLHRTTARLNIETTFIKYPDNDFSPLRDQQLSDDEYLRAVDSICKRRSIGSPNN